MLVIGSRPSSPSRSARVGQPAVDLVGIVITAKKTDYRRVSGQRQKRKDGRDRANAPCSHLDLRRKCTAIAEANSSR